MAITTASRTRPDTRFFLRPLGAAATAGILVLAGLAITLKAPTATPLAAFAALGIFSAAIWMLATERYELSLAVLMLYIGLADGYIKLSTDSSQATLVRDMLLYAIVAGALIRMAIRHERLKLPPLAGWVIAWALVVIVQVANPSNGSLTHSIAAIRPHAEWIPLFFLGYIVMRSEKRVRNFLLLLLFVAAANGVVGLIQSDMTPEELAAWGPGYEKAINGEGSVSARTFTDAEGTERTRPFALGGDFGFGGAIGVLAIPAALALLTLARRRGFQVLAAVLGTGAVVGIVTSQARTSVMAAFIAVLAFAALTVTSRAGLRTVIAIAVAAVVGYATVSVLSSGAEKGSFDRYESISSPGEAVSTAYDYRRNTLSKIPEYIADYPLGAGIGSSGPGASYPGGGENVKTLDGESEFTYLLIETGLPGLLVMLSFFVTLLWVSITRIRKIASRETRVLLTAVAAPLFSIFVTWIVGVSTATTPGSPYMWLAAGILSYWLLGEGREGLEREPEAEEPPVTAPALQPQWSRG